jgi:hypothetical protein
MITLYRISDITKIANCTLNFAYDKIKKYNYKPRLQKNNTNYYDEKVLKAIYYLSNHRKLEDVPIQTEQYQIFESKMNFE